MKEALKLALEALESSRIFVTSREKIKHPEGTDWYDERITAIKEALAQPEQEPVAWMLEGWGPDCGPYFEIYRNDEMGWRDKKEWTPLYTTPPQRTWVGLDEEDDIDWEEGGSLRDLVEAVEAKLKEKNT